jgi:hypothetical protein
VVSAGTDYPIGAGADAVGATTPALALPFALTVGLLSGAGIEPIIERGILKAAAAAGKKLTPDEIGKQVQLMRGILANESGQIPIHISKQIDMTTKLPDDEIFKMAVKNTDGAEITPDGLKINLIRFQPPEAGGMPSVRSGVFYLPEGSPNKKYYSTGKQGYGGSEKITGETLIRNPFFVKGATGGKAPEAAYDSILGKGSYEKMRKEALDVNWGRSAQGRAGGPYIEEFLDKYAPDLAGYGQYILDNSKKGNTLAYALQEAAVAHAVRKAGYDSVVGYGVGRKVKEPFISEVFDVRENEYPTKFGDYSIHPDFNITKAAVIEEINKEVGSGSLKDALRTLKGESGQWTIKEGESAEDAVKALAPVKGGSKKSGIPAPGDMTAKADEFAANKNPDITQETAGNIRLWGADLEPKFMGEIESPEDIMRVISGTHEAFADQAEAARRGVRSWDETAAEAKKYGIEDLLGRRLGQALNAEQIDNARTLLVSSADTLKGMAAVIRSGQANDLQKADFMRAFNVHYAIQMQLAGAAAEAGRALNIFRRVAQADAISVSKVKDFLSAASLDKRVGPEALADAISSMESPAQVAAFVKQAKRATTWDMFVEAWINGLLSGPTTHAVNVTSNLLTSLWVIPERLLAAGISRIHGGEIRMGEAAAQSFGLIQGFKDGLKLAGQALRTGEGAFDASSKIEGSGRRAITAENIRELPGIKKLAPNALDEGGMAARAVDLLGEGVRLPGRFLTAEDDFFKAIGYRMELQALAYRKGVSEGLSGDDLSKRIREIVSDPQKNAPEVHLAAIDAAKYQTYTNDLEAGGRGIQTAANKIPGLKLVIPFIRTPANILKFAVERTVLAPMMKNVRADIAAGGARRDMALAKISMGSMTMATVGALAAAGHITGGGPSDTALRSHMMNQGWQPYSIKIGDKYYAYGRLEPIGLILGLAADAVDIMGEAEDMDASELAAVISVAAAKNVTSKTWLRGLSDVVAALEDPDRYGEAYLQRFAGSAVPSAVAQVERTIDPEMSEVRSYVDAIKARTPGFSKDLPTRRNLWGEKITFNGALGPDIVSPIFTSSVKESPIDAELVKLKAPIRMPQRKQTFEGVPLNLTPQEYEEFVVRMNDVKLEDTNKNLKKSLNELVTKDRDYKSAEDEIKVKMIRGYIEEAVSKARIEMLESDSNLRALVDEGHRQAEAAAQ